MHEGDDMNHQFEPTPTSIRAMLENVLPEDSDFEAFCLDFFKDEVSVRISSSMDRTAKTNILLRRIAGADIISALSELPRFDQFKSLLRYDNQSLSVRQKILFKLNYVVIFLALTALSFIAWLLVKEKSSERKPCDGPLYPWERANGLPQLNNDFTDWDQMPYQLDAKKLEALSLIRKYFMLNAEIREIEKNPYALPCPSLVVGLYLNLALLEYQESALNFFLYKSDALGSRGQFQKEYIAHAAECVKFADLGNAWNSNILTSNPAIISKWGTSECEFSKKLLLSESGRMDEDLMWYRTACRTKLALHKIASCEEVISEIRRLQNIFPAKNSPVYEEAMGPLLKSGCKVP